MGEVFHVFDEDFQRYLVLKIILPRHKKLPTVIDSFIKEAQLTAQLEHPNIIPVHDLGFIPGYGIYFTMKIIKGESLKEILTKIKEKNSEYVNKYDGYELLKIIRKVCDAVSFAHSKDIIHQDIKPHNIMVGDYGEVLLMDWGMAKKCNSSKPKIEFNETKEFKSGKVGMIKGSPGYMSPEQAFGAESAIDQSSDIYLIGSTLYHIFTLAPPYTGKSLHTVLNNARANKHEPPDKQAYPGLNLPIGLSHIINKSMSALKKDRYQTVNKLIKDLDDLISGKIFYKARLFKDGEHLVHEGEAGEEAYIILDGQVEVYKESGGQKVVLSELTAGDTVGEMALITKEGRSANVVALTDTEVLVLNKEHFSRNLKNLPPWMEKIVVALANRLEETNKKLLAKK